MASAALRWPPLAPLAARTRSSGQTAGSNVVAWQYKTVRGVWITDCEACVGSLRDAAVIVR